MRLRAVTEAGWVGRKVHALADDPAREFPQELTVCSEDEAPFLYVVMDGGEFACYRKHPVGF